MYEGDTAGTGNTLPSQNIRTQEAGDITHHLTHPGHCSAIWRPCHPINGHQAMDQSWDVMMM